jgi:hypothetical protein
MLSGLRKMFAGGQQPAPYHRRWPRILMSEPSRVRLPRGETRSAILDQLCAGGARVQLSEKLRPGEIINLDFCTKAGQRHCLSARVIHGLKDDRGFQWRFGLQFVNLDPQERQRLGDFVEEENNRRRFGFEMPRN